MVIKQEEEEGIRRAVKEINEKIKEYEQSYAVQDKQDLLAMCALQYATEAKSFEGKTIIDEENIGERLEKLDKYIAENL
jgi:cell division protein ZapA